MREIQERLKKIDEALSRLESEFNNIIIKPTDTDAKIFRKPERTLKELRVAGIMDTFTVNNFKSECVLLELDSESWQSEMEEFGADMLFIESAWNGKNNSWYKKVANGSSQLYALASWCNEREIPVVFWNKEDPVFTETFLAAASCADFVFTTDIDCVEKYKNALNTDNVYLLHFAAQPLYHNPLEELDREDSFCFAGAYYSNYPERCRVFDGLGDILIKQNRLAIYDRNYGQNVPDRSFPKKYAPYILGNLKPEEIKRAYKGYRYNINMNSVSRSQSMFARRVFELLASNTVCVGNYSRGQRNLFGDLTISSDNPEEIGNLLKKYGSDERTYRKYRLLGLRRVLSAELCEDRLGFITEKVYGENLKRRKPKIIVFAPVSSKNDVQHAVKSFLRQTYSEKSLVLVTENESAGEIAAESIAHSDAKEKITAVSRDKLSQINGAAGEYFAVFSPEDYYGENYLTDLALTLRWRENASAVGKYARFECENGKITLKNGDKAYKYAKKLEPCCSIVRADMTENNPEQLLSGEALTFDEMIASDEFNYCKGYTGDKCDETDDLYVSDRGIVSEKLNALIPPHRKDGEKLYKTSSDMYIETKKSPVKRIRTRIEGDSVVIAPDEGGIGFVPLAQNVTLENGTALTLSGTVGENSALCVTGSSLGEITAQNGCGSMIFEHEQALDATIGIKVSGRGDSVIKSLTSSGGGNERLFISRSNILVILPAYPDYDDPYKYMYVHTRVRGYKKSGINCDVAVVSPDAKSRYREYDDINIFECTAQDLISVLEYGTIDTVVIHFVNRYIWGAVRPYVNEKKIFVWAHGYDIQPWQRRAYNFEPGFSLENEKRLSDERMALWREIIENDAVHKVFVSQYLRSTVEEDYSVRLDGQCSVIPNAIDTEFYSFKEKQPDDRFKILAIKSFANKNYANDIMLEALLMLSGEPEFKRLTVDIFGDGALFEESTAPLRRFSNIHLHKTYLTPTQIKREHDSHGIFLCTTRMDTHGVSRDEAMASGLVPVTNNVAAVGEFCDNDCAVLAEGEDARGIADGILRLLRDEELFLRLQRNASARVRTNTSAKITVPRELSLILGK